MDAIKLSQNVEPLWDFHLVDPQKTTATLSVNQPQKEEVVFCHKNPMGREIFYPVVFQDGDIYRCITVRAFAIRIPKREDFTSVSW